MTDQPDLARILQALDHHRVDYVLIGGQAALLHGGTQPTRDVDILARDQPDNMERVAAALEDLGAVSDMDEPPAVEALWGMNTRWNSPAGPVDVLVVARGEGQDTINWNDVHERAQRVASRGVAVTVVAFDDLVTMKLATARPHDLATLAELGVIPPTPDDGLSLDL